MYFEKIIKSKSYFMKSLLYILYVVRKQYSAVKHIMYNIMYYIMYYEVLT